MDVFFLLFSNLLPLYFLIGVGWFAGRYFEVDRKTLANLAIFVVVPVVIFGFVAEIELQPSYALLPVIAYAIHSILIFAALKLGKRVFRDSRANLMAMCAAMGNTGYFGLPLVIMLFDKQGVGVYTFLLMGNIIFEATIGYYVAMRGNFSVRESLRRLARFPTIYAVILGLAVNLMHIDLSEQFLTYRDYFKGAYVVVGMMIIGTALSKMNRLELNGTFLSLSFAGKFLMWPLIVYGFVYLDDHVLHLWGEQVHRLLLVYSLVPQGANITAFAAQLDLRPEKAATTVLLGTLFALFYIPAILVLLQLH